MSKLFDIVLWFWFLDVVNKMLLIDCDGCLIDNSLDDVVGIGIKEYELKKCINMYENNISIDNLNKNMYLINMLIIIRLCGGVVVGWTDRGETEREMTMRNLGWWGRLCVGEWRFCGGRKKKEEWCVGCEEGVVVENKRRNCVGGDNILVGEGFSVELVMKVGCRSGVWGGV